MTVRLSIGQISIRPAHPYERCIILSLRHAAFSHHAPQSYTQQEVDNLLEDVDQDELAGLIAAGQLLVAQDSTGCIIGSAGWQTNLIRHVYVRPDVGRCGVGATLLRSVEQLAAQDHSIEQLELGTGLYARGFYERQGYTLLEERRAWDDSLYCWMIKPLPPGTDR